MRVYHFAAVMAVFLSAGCAHDPEPAEGVGADESGIKQGEIVNGMWCSPAGESVAMAPDSDVALMHVEGLVELRIPEVLHADREWVLTDPDARCDPWLRPPYDVEIRRLCKDASPQRVALTFKGSTLATFDPCAGEPASLELHGYLGAEPSQCIPDVPCNPLPAIDGWGVVGHSGPVTVTGAP